MDLIFQDGLDYMHIYFFCTSHQINSGTRLICSVCKILLLSCYGFKKQCDESEALLSKQEAEETSFPVESADYLELSNEVIEDEDLEYWNEDSKSTDDQPAQTESEEQLNTKSSIPGKRKRRIHPNDTHTPTCPICKKTFSKASIPRHMRNVHDINFNDWKQEQLVKFNPLAKTEKCFYCPKHMLRKSMMMHVSYSHPESYQEYRERMGCKKKYNSSSIVLGKDVICDFCQTVFHRSSLKRHMLLIHLSSEMEYEEWAAKKKAQAQTDSNILVLEARESSEMNNAKQCPYCQRNFSCTSIKRHISTIHPGNLKEYEARHVERKRDCSQKKVKCRFCTGLFLKEELKSHLKSTHEIELKIALEKVEDIVYNGKPGRIIKITRTSVSPLKAEINAKRVKCRFCPQLFHKQALGKHIKGDHAKEFSDVI